jgi:hypothetical protein
MPCTRSQEEQLVDLPNDWSDEYDPDYSEGEDSDDSLPATMGRDRAQWTVDNYGAIEELYRDFLVIGKQLFGNAFHQCGNVTAFSRYIYKHTTPGAV